MGTTFPPSSLRPLLLAPSSTTASSSPFSLLPSAPPTSAPSLPTLRRSLFAPRRPALLPSPGAPPSSARPSRPTVSALSSTLLVLSPTRAPPTSVVSSLLPLLLPVSSSRPSARGGPSTPSVSASSPSSSRPSVSRSSSPGGGPAPTPSSKGLHGMI